MKKTASIAERVQRAVLAAMDRVTFDPAKLPRIGKPEIWEAAKQNVKRDTYRMMGTAVFQSLVHNVVDRIPAFQGPAFGHFDVRLVVDTLMSASTCARLLLTLGKYEDIPACPFIGMEALEVGDAMRVYLGALVASSDNALFRLRLWSDSAFTDLAAAAAKALEPDARIPNPKRPTTFAALKKSTAKPWMRKAKISTVLVGKVALAGASPPLYAPYATNKLAAAKVSQSLAQAKDEKKKTASVKRHRVTPYPINRALTIASFSSIYEEDRAGRDVAAFILGNRGGGPRCQHRPRAGPSTQQITKALRPTPTTVHPAPPVPSHRRLTLSPRYDPKEP
ncbi:hypothetical protein DFH09DRAFT_1085644 [Mycena vulgaris]|nr:hypothetical protein DFH09DRAFT_1085644 [Mycena vulgaris]